MCDQAVGQWANCKPEAVCALLRCEDVVLRAGADEEAFMSECLYESVRLVSLDFTTRIQLVDLWGCD